VPALALVALVEGTVSPGTRFPVPMKAALGFALAGALWGWLFLATAPSEASPDR